MTSAPKVRIDGPGGQSFEETRLVDTPDLRLAELRAMTHPGQIGILRDRLVGALQEFEIRSESGLPQTCMAIEEALANAIYHGNLGLDSSLKETGPNTFSDLARERSAAAPWKDRSIFITELATPFGLWITIADEGRGFDFRKAIQRGIDPEAMLASGRGLVMMRAFADELLFNASGNEVTLVFYGVRNLDVKELLKQRATSRSASDSSRHSLI